MKFKKTTYIFVIVLLLVILVRAPGLFWGYHVFGNENIAFITGEAIIVSNAKEFLDPTFYNRYSDYMKGFPFQITLLSIPLSIFIKISLPILAAIGRVLSLFYAFATIVLIYLFYRLIRKENGIYAALLLALSGAHIIYSHIAKADISSIFWLYFVFLFAYLYSKRNDLIYFLLACIGTGFAAGTKYVIITMIPILYLSLFKGDLKNKIINLLIAFFVIAGSFSVINGFSWGVDELNGLIYSTVADNIGIRDYNKVMNIPVHFFNIIAGLGLFSFIVCLIGFFYIFKKKWDKDLFFIIALPLLFQSFMIYFYDYAPFQNILPIIPALCLVGAVGIDEVKKKVSNKIFILLISLFIIYQLIYVFSIEYNYVIDVRKESGEWMLNNIGFNEKIYTGNFKSKIVDEGSRAVDRNLVILPSQYTNLVKFDEADYAVFLDAGVYLKSWRNPFKDPECCKEVIHCDYEECVLTQKVFKGQTDFELINKFEIKAVTPELWLYKAIFGPYQICTGDIYIFKRK